MARVAQALRGLMLSDFLGAFWLAMKVSTP